LEQKSEPALFGKPFHVVFQFYPAKAVFFSHRTVVPWEAQVQSSLFLDVSQVGNFQVSTYPLA
jgi:hypothetical protein